MKLYDGNFTDFRHLPADEADAVMAELAKAEAADDLKALKKCARLLLWLYGAFKADGCKTDTPFEFDECEFKNIEQFNAAWERELKKTTDKIIIERGEFSGRPTLSLKKEGDEQPFIFGLSKADLLLQALLQEPDFLEKFIREVRNNYEK